MRSRALPFLPCLIMALQLDEMPTDSTVVSDGIYEFKHVISDFSLGAFDSENGLLLLEECSSSRTIVS